MCSSLAGVLAGTLGLTGLPGFALFLLNALLVRSLFAVTKIGKADYSRYFVGGKWELATGGLPSEGFGFILFWTREFISLSLSLALLTLASVFYSLVHSACCLRFVWRALISAQSTTNFSSCTPQLASQRCSYPPQSAIPQLPLWQLAYRHRPSRHFRTRSIPGSIVLALVTPLVARGSSHDRLLFLRVLVRVLPPASTLLRRSISHPHPPGPPSARSTSVGGRVRQQ